MPDRLLQRRDSEADWAAVVPAQGEIGYVDGTGADPTEGRFKIGDGSTAFGSLDYAAPATPNPAGGQENFAPIASPTFTGTAIAPILAVESAATLASGDPASVPMTVVADALQSADLVSIVDSAELPLVTVDLSGSVTFARSLRVGAAAYPNVVADGATGDLTASTDATHTIAFDPGDVGDGAEFPIDVDDGGTSQLLVRGDGRVQKFGAASTGDDLLDRAELDARYTGIGDGWIPSNNSSSPNFVNGYRLPNGGSVGFSGTHIVVYFTWTQGGAQTITAATVTSVTDGILSFPAGFNYRIMSFRVA